MISLLLIINKFHKIPTLQSIGQLSILIIRETKRKCDCFIFILQKKPGGMICKFFKNRDPKKKETSVFISSFINVKVSRIEKFLYIVVVFQILQGNLRDVVVHNPIYVILFLTYDFPEIFSTMYQIYNHQL